MDKLTKFRQISHVIFDLDGVLLDTEPLYTKAIQNVVGKYGKTFTWEIKTQMMGSTRFDGANMLIDKLELPITWEEYDRLVHEEYNIVLRDTEIFPVTIARRFGKTYTNEIAAKVTGTIEPESARIAVTEMKLPIPVEDFRNEFRTTSHLIFAKYGAPIMPGAKKVAHHLSKHNIPISVATSSSQDGFKLKTENHKEFFKLFDHIVCGDGDSAVKEGKPAPDIFLVSAARFPDKPSPEKCLVFEDSPNGVLAAVRAGMQVVMLPDENIPEEFRKDATIVVSALDETPFEKFGLPPLEK